MKYRTHRFPIGAATRLLLAAGLAFSSAHLTAAILSFEPSGPQSMALSTTLEPASYFLLEQSTDLQNFSPFSMVLGSEPRTYSLSLDPEDDPPPARFFRAKILDASAPSDTDGDGIDDVYEIRHPVLNPLDPNDASRDPDNNGLTYLQEYRLQFGITDGKKEAISSEISVFNTLPFTGPSLEAISQEVSIFNTLPVTSPAAEAVSQEVSVFNTLPVATLAAEAISQEVSIFNTLPVSTLAAEAISQEVSVFNTLPFTGPSLEAISQEVSVVNKINSQNPP